MGDLTLTLWAQDCGLVWVPPGSSPSYVSSGELLPRPCNKKVSDFYLETLLFGALVAATCHQDSLPTQ